MRGRLWIQPILAVLLTAASGGWFAGAAAADAAATCQAWGAQPVNVAGDTLLRAVAVTSSCNAWTAGYEFNGSTWQTVIEHWNGTAWKVQPSVNPGGASDLLDGIAAASSSRAWAVGSYENAGVSRTLIEHWNGVSWKRVPSPDPEGSTGDGLLFGVAATSATSAWAVGYQNSAIGVRGLVEHWNGTAWKVVPSPHAGTSDDTLQSVSATSAANAWAVGWDFNGPTRRTLIEHWNGKAWKVLPSPSAGTGDNFLWSVDATSASNAWAAGWYQTAAGGFLTLLEHWNGTAWRRIPTPSPGGPGNTNTLWGVAGTDCDNAWAVGYYSTGTGNSPMALHC